MLGQYLTIWPDNQQDPKISLCIRFLFLDAAVVVALLTVVTVFINFVTVCNEMLEALFDGMAQVN